MPFATIASFLLVVDLSSVATAAPPGERLRNWTSAEARIPRVPHDQNLEETEPWMAALILEENLDPRGGVHHGSPVHLLFPSIKFYYNSICPFIICWMVGIA